MKQEMRDVIRAWKPLGLVAAVVSSISFLAPPASSIVIRHDREDGPYRKLGEGHPYVGSLRPVGNGAVTLIHPRFALTAAHVAQSISPFKTTILFDGKAYSVDRVIFHPTWGGPEGPPVAVDMAILRLSAPVEGVKPVPLYDTKDEIGQTVLFVGWGDTGDGIEGPRTQDRQRRGATNVVSGEMGDWIKFVFDEPPAGTELEGISGPGDSGGPAFLERDGKLHLAGVSASNESLPGKGHCTYGSTEYYPRVSSQVAWIRGILDGKQEPAQWGEVRDLADHELPSTPAGEVARAFFDAMTSSDLDALREFETRHRAPAALKEQDVDQRLRGWKRKRRMWGPLEPHRFAEGSDGIYVLVRKARAKGWAVFHFEMREGKLLEVRDRRARPPE